jgi:methionyl aminopeptidase
LKNKTMITIKTPEEIEKIIEGGKILAWVLDRARLFVLNNYKSGELTTKKVDERIAELISKKGAKSAFLGYSSGHNQDPFPGNACISVDDEVVHGIPSDRVLSEGDVLNIDLGIVYKKLYTDASVNFILGKGSDHDKKLVKVSYDSLYKGIEMVKEGNTVGDIGHAIEKYVKSQGLDVIRSYCGHGVGYDVHEDPQIPNYGNPGEGDILKEGMVIAIEPMIISGSNETSVDQDGWTVKTLDGKKATQYEHTVIVTKDKPIIVTEL